MKYTAMKPKFILLCGKLILKLKWETPSMLM